jgi:hypothetical protein
MQALDQASLLAAANKLIEYHRQASELNEWTFFVDQMYAKKCCYTCEYAGTMLVTADGIDEIKATHYGRDMQVGWEGWTFPYMGVYAGTNNSIITHWMNRGPGRRADGEYYETPGVSILTIDSDARIIRQFDMFDLAHQMKLCDELESQGQLSPDLKENWVTPMKAKLVAQLNEGS